MESESERLGAVGWSEGAPRGAGRSARLGEGDDDLLDIRVALVLYGGVSLAIYENGVTRCFYELVKRQGVFAILLDLLGAKAQVDVIAGTSAGGINGLLLAATLESGADFTDSANLWRRLGDFGTLLRDTKDADSAHSLLQGESYFQDKLIEAFRKYCTPPEQARGEEYPGEIDVFVTGTDLDGAERKNWDALGSLISDKEHRVLFHLEHRAGRKALGCGRKKKAETNPDEQGTILGTIARITSSFPAAFPPFQLSHLESRHGQFQKAVQDALEGTARSGIEQATERTFADGGLLDNKPFGPVLEAIFHRMPTSIVDRRLFYVEPDPLPRPAAPDPKRHTPLAVVAGALHTIPSHESIWGDLQQLGRHNARVKWLSRVKAAAEQDAARKDAAADPRPSSPYWKTRCEGLARSLFLASDVTAPSAENAITNPDHRKLVDLIAGAGQDGRDPEPETDRETHSAPRRGLLRWTESESGEAPDGFRSERPLLNAFDVDYHLRRSFHLLYGLFELLEKSPQGEAAENREKCRTAMQLTGRIIKTQKMIRDFLLVLRENVLREASPLLASGLPDLQGQRAVALFILNLFRLFLRADAPHWESLRRHCAVGPEYFRGIGDDWRGFFHTDDLSEASRQAAIVVAQPAANLTQHLSAADPKDALTKDDVSVRWTILDEIERATHAVLESYCRGENHLDAFAVAFDRFMQIDQVVYPLEFTAAVYELDNIECVRISPQDAQTGLSKGDPREKVAGDELAHFSALLRQDWRSNDIMQGRLDGICQIVHSLLEPTAQTARRLAAWGDPSRIFDNRINCKDESRAALQTAWRELVELLPAASVASDEEMPSQFVEALDRFRTCLIRVGQEDAFLADFPSVLEDHFYQELAFAKRPDSKGGEPTSDTLQRCEAKKSCKEALELAAGNDEKETVRSDTKFDGWWKLFREMNLGGQPISGREGVVPPHTVGEYTTQVYLLLYGMIRSSVGRTGQALLDQKTVRVTLRHPLAFLHVVFTLMRRAYTVALGSIATTAGLLLGLAAATYFLGEIPFMIGAIALLLLFMTLVAWAVPRIKNRQLLVTLLPVLFLGAVALAAKIGLELPTWRDPVVKLIGDPNAPIAFLIGLVAGAVICAIVAMRRQSEPDEGSVSRALDRIQKNDVHRTGTEAQRDL